MQSQAWDRIMLDRAHGSDASMHWAMLHDMACSSRP